MGVNFTAASTQYFKNSSPLVTATPFTVAFWSWINNTGSVYTVFSLAAGAGGQYFEIMANAGTWTQSAFATVSPATDNAGTYSANAWNFIVGRFISATNRRITSYNPGTGVITEGQSTTSKAPVVNTMGIGARVTSTVSQPMDGLVGEFWYTNADIQADGAALSTSLMRQLAYGGPWSVPHVANMLQEYLPMEDALPSDARHMNQFGRKITTWAKTGSPVLGVYPPLPYWCVEKSQRRSLLVI